MVKQAIKKSIRFIMRLISPDWEYQSVRQHHFDQLGRTPPELIWKSLSPCPTARLDAGAAQIGRKIYIFAGYDGFGTVTRRVDVFDMDEERWIRRLPIPDDMPQSHLGVIGDGKRYIYTVAGQFGDECHPAVNRCYVYDTESDSWGSLPPLPAVRYAPTVQLWRGRLHAVGGSKEDRNEPAMDHWSIAVEGGRAIEEAWREEPSIPRGGPHRSSAILNDKLYVFGGQEGDFIAIPGDPQYRCTFELTCEEMYPDVYCLEPGGESWMRMADIPVQVSHTEFSILRFKNQVILFAGQMEKNDKTKEITLTDSVQLYHAGTDEWRLIGKLPYRSKSVVVGYHEGHVYFTTGQKDVWTDNPTPGEFDRALWKAPLKGLL